MDLVSLLECLSKLQRKLSVHLQHDHQIQLTTGTEDLTTDSDNSHRLIDEETTG